MRDEEATIGGTLKGTEDSGTGGGSLDTNIHKSLEWSLVTFWLNISDFTVDLVGSFIVTIKLNLLEESSGEEETSGIMSRVVGETSGETVMLKFSGISSAHDMITSHGSIDDLSDDSSTGSSNDESVFLRVILVLSLADESSSGVEIGLTLSSSLWLNLHSLGVSFVFDDFNE